jgi:hypothetical protein
MKPQASKIPIQTEMNAQLNQMTKLWWSSGFLFNNPFFFDFPQCLNLPVGMSNMGSRGHGTAFEENGLEKNKELRGRNG